MCVYHVLVFGPNTCFLRQILVIVRWNLFAPLKVDWFLCRGPHLGIYLWATSRPSVMGAGGVANTNHIAKNWRDGWIRMGEVTQVCLKLFWRKQFISQIPIPNMNYSLSTGPVRDLELEICGSSGITDKILIWMLTQILTCKIGSSVFVAMSWLKVASKTCASLPRTPSTERINGYK